MDKIKALIERNPVALTQAVGQRLKSIRLAKGWTREEVADRAGIALSTLKLLETKGQGSFQRLAKVAVALGIDAELRGLFARPSMESIEAVKRSERRRAPRRKAAEAHGA